jgi:ADP-ribosylglycohydrolase
MCIGLPTRQLGETRREPALDCQHGKERAVPLDHSQTDRRRGAILGLAIGDALGAAVEFQPAGSFPEVTGFRAGGPHGLEPGEWTDDTSMALALADSIAEVGWDLTDQAERYVAWWTRGTYSVNGRVFDIGITTVRALQRFRETGDPWTSGDPSPRASGNGSIMRLAPVPVAYVRFFPGQLDLLVDRLVESSRPTHASPQCLSACAYTGVLMAGLLNGVPRDQVLDPQWEPVTKLHERFPMHPEILEVYQGSFRARQPPRIQGSGYVVRSLEAALWAFHDAVDFRHAVLRAVNLGDDADTTGAVCGQLAGAWFGESEIPSEWRRELAGKDQIEPILQRLTQ